MQPIKPIQVLPGELAPEIKRLLKIAYDNNRHDMGFDIDHDELVEKLQPQSLYVFDRKELEGLLGAAFDAATEETVYPDSSCGRSGIGGQTITGRPKWQNKSEYLKTLFEI